MFVIDEAHMYRGSSGGEVALLIRRLFHKLGISRDRVQFILTTASMPNKNQQDYDSVMKFANELTASDTETQFRYLTGEREVIDGQLKYGIPSELLLNADPGEFEDKDELKLSALLSSWPLVFSQISIKKTHLKRLAFFWQLLHLQRMPKDLFFFQRACICFLKEFPAFMPVLMQIVIALIQKEASLSEKYICRMVI